MPEERVTLSVYERRRVRIGDVREVLSFDETGAHVICEDGELFVEGEDIRIEGLDKEKGGVEITGRINGIFYADSKEEKKKKMRGRLFG